MPLMRAPHPLSYSLDVAMVKTNAWQEGTGLDMDNYSDLGESNWEFSTPGNEWALQGGDYYGVGATLSSSFFFDGGTVDLELNINFAVDKWRTNKTIYPNYGLLVKNTDPVISGSGGDLFYQDVLPGERQNIF